MDTQTPRDDERAPGAPADESTEERHTRELVQSVDALEDTIETGIAHLLKTVVPLVLGVFVTCGALYLLGRRLRKRARCDGVTLSAD